MMTYEEIKQNVAIRTYITQADASLSALGFKLCPRGRCGGGRGIYNGDSGLP